MKIRCLFISLILVFGSLNCLAVTVQGLYEASVPVTDKSPSSQAKGIYAALVQVMVKLTGKRNVTSIYGINALLENANRYLQQYEFQTIKDPESNFTTTRLWARFDQNVLESAMREYSIPIWSQERPATLIWMAVEDDLGQRFAKLDQNSRYFRNLNEQAAARGISFVTPLYDLQDSATLKVTDIANNRTGPIKQASSRYLSDTVLATYISSIGPGLWQANWTALINDRPHSWTTSGSSVGEVISEGVDGMADTLASIYSQDVGYASESNFDITVTGIASFEAYAKTLNYLDSLNFINTVDIKSVSGNNTTYSVTAHGGASALQQATNLGSVLKSTNDDYSYRYLQ